MVLVQRIEADWPAPVTWSGAMTNRNRFQEQFHSVTDDDFALLLLLLLQKAIQSEDIFLIPMKIVGMTFASLGAIFIRLGPCPQLERPLAVI